jgi:hypothetical protein
MHQTSFAQPPLNDSFLYTPLCNYRDFLKRFIVLQRKERCFLLCCLYYTVEPNINSFINDVDVKIINFAYC